MSGDAAATPTRPSLSVVIPAFNESESLRSTVDAVLGSLAASADPASAELVLVDDGSTDDTRAVMQSIAVDCIASVVIVAHDLNGGMGSALSSGCAAATGDVITWIPGDGEYDLTEVLAGLPLLADHDIVLVQRTSRGQLGRNIVSSAMYLLIRLLFGFDARGYCGIFIVPRHRYDELQVTSRDVFFTLEVALRSRHQQRRLARVTAEWIPRRAGRSKVFNMRTVVRNVGELFRFRWTLWRGR